MWTVCVSITGDTVEGSATHHNVMLFVQIALFYSPGFANIQIYMYKCSGCKKQDTDDQTDFKQPSCVEM